MLPGLVLQDAGHWIMTTKVCNYGFLGLCVTVPNTALQLKGAAEHLA